MTDSGSETEVNSLCAELDAYVEQRSRLFERGLYCFVLSFGSLAILSLALAVIGNTLDHTPFNRILVLSYGGLSLCVVAALLLPMFWFMVTTWNRDIQRKAERLREIRALSASGTLLRLLSMDDAKVKRSAEQGLVDLVPFWGEEEFSAFTTEDRQRIRHSIAPPTFNPRLGRRQGNLLHQRTFLVAKDLRIALCRKAAWFGNSEDLRALKYASRLAVPFVRTREVQQAAKEAAALLEARLAERGRPETLLRASEAPAAQPDELLRAASASAGTPEHELMRPSGSSAESSPRSAHQPRSDDSARL